jgi:hypothetical protein
MQKFKIKQLQVKPTRDILKALEEELVKAPASIITAGEIGEHAKQAAAHIEAAAKAGHIPSPAPHPL